jgi:hypothetical protein
MKNFLIFICSNRSDFFYPPIINSRLGKPFFLRCDRLPPEGVILMRQCVEDFGFFFLLWSTPASPPNSPWRTMRTGAWPRRRSTATEGLPNQSMSLVRPAPGVASHPEDHGDRRDRRGTAIPHAVDRAVRSAFGGPHVAMRKARHQNGRESACARGDTGGMKRAAETPTRVLTLRPALFCRTSRSSPTKADRTNAKASSSSCSQPCPVRSNNPNIRLLRRQFSSPA